MNKIKEKLAALQKKYEESPFDHIGFTFNPESKEITESLLNEIDTILDELIELDQNCTNTSGVRTFTSEPDKINKSEKPKTINIGGYKFINNIDSKAIEDLANLSFINFDSEEERIKYIEEQNERFKHLFKELDMEPLDPNYKFHYPQVKENSENIKFSPLSKEELIKRHNDLVQKHSKRLKDL
jgi:hypothetical protein